MLRTFARFHPRHVRRFDPTALGVLLSLLVANACTHDEKNRTLAAKPQSSEQQSMDAPAAELSTQPSMTSAPESQSALERVFTPRKARRLPATGSVSLLATGPMSALSTGRMDAPSTGAMAATSAHNTETYDHQEDRGFRLTNDDPRSTFSVDVDTASYANIRRFLQDSQLPPEGAVRIEEMVNYFRYDYPQPTGSAPFRVTVDTAEAPWAPAHRLVRIGLQGKTIPDSERPRANLVFLIDVSGSMAFPNKLPLLKTSLTKLLGTLRGDDQVAIVVYAGASGLVLPSTPVRNGQALRDALERLEAGGSTNGGEGIQLAYDVARQEFIRGGVNRVILATDGDFNVGISNQSDLVTLIQDKAKSGVFLTVLGFGMGNYKDSTLEKIADKGNGQYAYIDSEQEAHKVLVREVGGTLFTIAKDVKIQVEFNPLEARAWRLIGYENRVLAHQDFNDDKKDAGDVGAGHQVTALYEVVPAGSDEPLPGVGPLTYQQPTNPSPRAHEGELLSVKLRHKHPDGDKSVEMNLPVRDAGRTLTEAPSDFRFAASVAGFGMILRNSPYKGNLTIQHVLSLGEDGATLRDPYGDRQAFLSMVRQAEPLLNPQARR
jgi:Ca-activated chloride channel homolog